MLQTMNDNLKKNLVERINTQNSILVQNLYLSRENINMIFQQKDKLDYETSNSVKNMQKRQFEQLANQNKIL